MQLHIHLMALTRVWIGWVTMGQHIKEAAKFLTWRFPIQILNDRIALEIL